LDARIAHFRFSRCDKLHCASWFDD